jgi:glycosyl transferase family 87
MTHAEMGNPANQNCEPPATSVLGQKDRRWFWPRSILQARTHAMLMAAVLWVALIITYVAGDGDRSIAGPLKGADFVHFYTLGSVARTHHPEALYDFAALHHAQVSLVPASEPEVYVPVYPPQTALLFAPFSLFSFNHATLLWNLVTIAAFAVIVHSARRPVARLLPDSRFVFAAAAAFPPFWSLILHGQTTLVVLTAYWLGWLALEQRRHFLAGMAFGLLLVKPQFGIPLAMLVLVFREWEMLAGAIASIILQVAAIAMLLGWSVLTAYVKFLPIVLKNADLLEPKPFQTHSLSALTRLAPPWIGVPLWIVLSVTVLAISLRVWKTSAPLRVRLGMLILASVLVNPHLNVYDATVLVLPIIWLGAHVLERNERSSIVAFWTCVYWLYVAFLAPSAALIGIQVSVLLMVWLVVQTARLQPVGV